MNEQQHKQLLYKILVVGDIGVGKTSIIKRYVHGIFSQHYKSTIGVDFALKIINWDPNTTIRLQLWDIAGQERFGNMTRVYFKDAIGAIIVYDVTRNMTFQATEKWKDDIDRKVTYNDKPIPIVLIANKIDLLNNENPIPKEQLDKFCEEKGFCGWFDTSAKDNLNLDKSINFLVKDIVENIIEEDNKREILPDLNTIKIMDKEYEEKMNRCDC